ncbi:tyrosine-type recombinase/integrase [Corynebacterium flavescens]|uniref:tyrosine-type recombinase/integrase n=1 Tax=Corynebacterium flavescens TaxID=28028 RepID=UPI0026491214|nr:site-specific integrase [Corynebacterium flavescens]MDN6199338.1 site-specific integrase [Corynebacterium flavescens]
MTVHDLWLKRGGAHTARHGVGKRWQVRWIDLDGKATSRTFSTKEEADFFDASVKVKKADGTLISADKKDVRLEEIWPAWLDSKAGIAEKSRKDYISKWNVHIRPAWGRRRVADIQDHQVIAWIAALTTMKGVPQGQEPRPVSGSQKKKIADMMSGLLTRAVKMKVIPANPLDGIAKPRVKPGERRYLNVEEIDAILAAAKTDEVKLMLEVLLKTGLRVGEAKGLKVKDLDVDRKRIAIRRDVDDLGRLDETKSRHHRDVPLSQLMTLLLEEAARDKTPEAWLLPDERGHVWTTARWRAIWDNLLIDAGLETTLKTHELRHTAVSMAIAGGADVYIVQRMCGHASATTTLNTYGHLWDGGLDRAAEAIETHLAAERKRIESQQARRAQRGRENGRGHLRLVR